MYRVSSINDQVLSIKYSVLSIGLTFLLSTFYFLLPNSAFGAAIIGKFPSLLGSDGARAIDTDIVWFGELRDKEGNSKQTDADSDDGVSAEFNSCAESRANFLVHLKKPGKTGGMAYLNLWADWNRDGEWSGGDKCAAEWAVKNYEIDLSKQTEDIWVYAPEFIAGENVENIWHRAVVSYNEKLTREDGGGEFAAGEVEDYGPVGVISLDKETPPNVPRRPGIRGLICYPSPILIEHGGAAAFNVGVMPGWDRPESTGFGGKNSGETSINLPSGNITKKPNNPDRFGDPQNPFVFTSTQVHDIGALEKIPVDIEATYSDGKTKSVTCTVLVWHPEPPEIVVVPPPPQDEDKDFIPKKPNPLVELWRKIKEVVGGVKDRVVEVVKDVVKTPPPQTPVPPQEPEKPPVPGDPDFDLLRVPLLPPPVSPVPPTPLPVGGIPIHDGIDTHLFWVPPYQPPKSPTLVPEAIPDTQTPNFWQRILNLPPLIRLIQPIWQPPLPTKEPTTPTKEGTNIKPSYTTYCSPGQQTIRHGESATIEIITDNPDFYNSALTSGGLIVQPGGLPPLIEGPDEKITAVGSYPYSKYTFTSLLVHDRDPRVERITVPIYVGFSNPGTNRVSATQVSCDIFVVHSGTAPLPGGFYDYPLYTVTPERKEEQTQSPNFWQRAADYVYEGDIFNFPPLIQWIFPQPGVTYTPDGKGGAAPGGAQFEPVPEGPAGGVTDDGGAGGGTTPPPAPDVAPQCYNTLAEKKALEDACNDERRKCDNAATDALIDCTNKAAQAVSASDQFRGFRGGTACRADCLVGGVSSSVTAACIAKCDATEAAFNDALQVEQAKCTPAYNDETKKCFEEWKKCRNDIKECPPPTPTPDGDKPGDITQKTIAPLPVPPTETLNVWQRIIAWFEPKSEEPAPAPSGGAGGGAAGGGVITEPGGGEAGAPPPPPAGGVAPQCYNTLAEKKALEDACDTARKERDDAAGATLIDCINKAAQAVSASDQFRGFRGGTACRADCPVGGVSSSVTAACIAKCDATEKAFNEAVQNEQAKCAKPHQDDLDKSFEEWKKCRNAIKPCPPPAPVPTPSGDESGDGTQKSPRLPGIPDTQSLNVFQRLWTFLVPPALYEQVQESLSGAPLPSPEHYTNTSKLRDFILSPIEGVDEDRLVFTRKPIEIFLPVPDRVLSLPLPTPPNAPIFGVFSPFDLLRNLVSPTPIAPVTVSNPRCLVTVLDDANQASRFKYEAACNNYRSCAFEIRNLTNVGTLVSRKAFDLPQSGSLINTDTISTAAAVATLQVTCDGISYIAIAHNPNSGGNNPGGNTSAGTAPTITTTTLSDGTNGTAYSQTVSATGGSGTYYWTIVSGALPTGLTINPSSGVISGTPSVTNTFNFTVRAAAGTESNALNDTQALSIIIATGVEDLVITTTDVPDKTAGVPSSDTIVATGGTAPYTWSITDPGVPCLVNNYAINPGTGALTSNNMGGTGTCTLTVHVEDSQGTPDTDDQVLTFDINAP